MQEEGRLALLDVPDERAVKVGVAAYDLARSGAAGHERLHRAALRTPIKARAGRR